MLPWNRHLTVKNMALKPTRNPASTLSSPPVMPSGRVPSIEPYRMCIFARPAHSVAVPREFLALAVIVLVIIPARVSAALAISLCRLPSRVTSHMTLAASLSNVSLLSPFAIALMVPPGVTSILVLASADPAESESTTMAPKAAMSNFVLVMVTFVGSIICDVQERRSRR